MKIDAANRAYSAQMNSLKQQRAALQKQKTALEGESGDKEQLGRVNRELDRIDIQYDRASKQSDKLNDKAGEVAALQQNLQSSNEQCEAMAKKSEDTAKYFEIARRISRGDIVPPKDEQKLLEFSDKMYQMAKLMAASAHNSKPKKHKSLWEDEEESSVNETSSEQASCEQSAPQQAPCEPAAPEQAECVEDSFFG